MSGSCEDCGNNPCICGVDIIGEYSQSIQNLKKENKKLREALRKIAYPIYPIEAIYTSDLVNIAKKALEKV